MEAPGDLQWRKSSRCESNACVEVAAADEFIFMRNSTDPDGPQLRFTREEWAAFCASLQR